MGSRAGGDRHGSGGGYGRSGDGRSAHCVVQCLVVVLVRGRLPRQGTPNLWVEFVYDCVCCLCVALIRCLMLLRLSLAPFSLSLELTPHTHTPTHRPRHTQTQTHTHIHASHTRTLSLRYSLAPPLSSTQTQPLLTKHNHKQMWS